MPQWHGAWQNTESMFGIVKSIVSVLKSIITKLNMDFRMAKINIEEDKIRMTIQTHKYPLDKRINRVLKRTFDILFSAFVLLAIYPWAYIVIATCIKLKMPGKVLFLQKRTGKDGREFVCYKFRTMRPNAEADTRQACDGDPRITPFGHFLRMTSLDELPQFWNVLIGDMSVIGPRPHMLAHTAYYSKLIPEYDQRLTVYPGLTGWAQVHNLRGDTQDIERMKARVEYDLWYIRHWSFMLDLKIMFKTLNLFFK